MLKCRSQCLTMPSGGSFSILPFDTMESFIKTPRDWMSFCGCQEYCSELSNLTINFSLVKKHWLARANIVQTFVCFIFCENMTLLLLLDKNMDKNKLALIAFFWSSCWAAPTPLTRSYLGLL